MQVIPLVLHAPETDPAQPVDLEDVLLPRRTRAHVDVALLAAPHAGAHAVDGPGFGVPVQGQVVESAVGQAVAVVRGVFHAGDQVGASEDGDGAVDGAGGGGGGGGVVVAVSVASAGGGAVGFGFVGVL